MLQSDTEDITEYKILLFLDESPFYFLSSFLLFSVYPQAFIITL